MGGRGVPDLIDCLHGRVDRCIKSDRIFCTGNIQVDSSRKSNSIDPMSCQCLCSSVRTITANDNQTVNSMLLADLCCLQLGFLCLELRTSCCSKDRSTTLNGIGNILLFHINDLFI